MPAWSAARSRAVRPPAMIGRIISASCRFQYRAGVSISVATIGFGGMLGSPGEVAHNTSRPTLSGARWANSCATAPPSE